MAEILVVDDSKALQRMWKSVLEGEGYAVRTAVNGDEALEKIYIRKPALVLMDVNMPTRNGFSTCEEIRRFDPLIPILFLTAFPTDANELRARGVGADDFFAKDVEPSIIIAAIRRALARTEAAATEVRRTRIGNTEIDFDMLTARGGGVDERLTKTEADFLYLLNSERGRYFSYDEIFEVLRGKGYIGDDNLLYVYISRLKRKLAPAGIDIRNERGIGYALMG